MIFESSCLNVYIYKGQFKEKQTVAFTGMLLFTLKNSIY